MNSTHAILAAGILAAGLASCNRTPDAAAGNAGSLAQLAPVATNDIAKTPALLTVAMDAGKTLYDTHCSSCHGADLKGIADKHTPDLTDNEWVYVGDDLDTGGAVHTAADVEKTILLGIRAIPRVTNLATQQENDAKNLPTKNLADMPAMAMDPDALTDAEITDAAEYVLRLGGQDHDATMAGRGKVLFEGDEGGCYDCHEPEGTGDGAIGSTNLTKPSLYLYGSTREAILASIRGGRAGVSPAFQGKLKPEEAKAIAVYVFSKGGPGSLPPAL